MKIFMKWLGRVSAVCFIITWFIGMFGIQARNIKIDEIEKQMEWLRIDLDHAQQGEQACEEAFQIYAYGFMWKSWLNECLEFSEEIEQYQKEKNND